MLVNQTYAATVSRKGGADEDKTFLSQCLQTANWLTKSLEQRARTIYESLDRNRAATGRLSRRWASSICARST